MTNAGATVEEFPRPRIAVVGCGHWGRNLVRNFAALGALAAVCDSDTDRAEQVAGTHGAPAMDWAAVLASPDIHAVAIAAPAVAHADLTRAALLAGKDVFVEKPLALDIGAGEQLCALAEGTGRILMVGHLLRYHPAFLRLQEIVESGALGRIRYLYSSRLNFGRIRNEENILWSFAPHDISMILALMCEEPSEVTAHGAGFINDRIADVTTTHMNFRSGASAHIFVSWLHPFKEQKLVVVGEKGMAVFDVNCDWPEKVMLYGHQVHWRDGLAEAAKGKGEGVPVDPAEPLKLECGHFLDCVARRQRPHTDGREALRVLSVLQAAESSLHRPLAPSSPSPPPSHGAEVFIHASAVVDDGVEIGANTRIWHFSHILGYSRLGRDCIIGQNVMIGPRVTIGDRCKIQNNVSVYPGVTLEDGVFCGPSCVFTNVMTPRAEIERKDEFLPTLVKRGATIGANATIVCGVTLGAYCLVGAGAVVTRDVPAHALMAGNPARQIGWVSHAGERLGPDLVCPREGRRYRETDGELEHCPTDGDTPGGRSLAG